MKWIERHLGRYAIRNLSLYIAILQMIGFVLELVNSSFLNYISLSPADILHGQIFRLITWVVMPPTSSNILFIPISILFYYTIGVSLERAWGTTRYNIYILGGVLFTIIGAFLTYGIAGVLWGNGSISAFMVQSMIPFFFTTYYVMMSIFLAYAATFPDAVVLFMFILPVQVKYLGIFYFVWMLYSVYETWRSVSALGMGFVAFVECMAIAASLLNFAIFFLMTRDWRRSSVAERRRRKAWRQQHEAGRIYHGKTVYDLSLANADPDEAQESAAAHMRAGRTIHKCAICGRTEVSDPDLEFRYCSKCDSGYEFCQDHLFTHVHARNGSAPVLMEQQSVTVEQDGNGEEPQ